MGRLKTAVIAVILLTSTLAGCTSSDTSDLEQHITDLQQSNDEMNDLQQSNDEMNETINQQNETIDQQAQTNTEISVDCASPAERGVVLSFDDRKNIQSWGENRDFLNSRSIKATFFVDNWKTIEDWELEVLRNLSSDGHEIGFHSTSHGDYYDFLEQNLTAEDYMEIEIVPGLESMEGSGFYPTSFAYPRGHRDVELDQLILSQFSVLRGTRTNVNGSESWMAQCEDLRVFRSFSLFDEDDHWISHAFNESVNTPMSILLFGHGIDGGGYSISIELLSNVIDEIERLELPYLLMSDLAE